MLVKFKYFFFVVCMLTFVQCTHKGVLIKETPQGVSETRRVIASIMGVPRSVSENGRELYSQYYDRKGRVDEFKNAKERLYSKVTILGERRPYDIEVLVVIQNKQPDGRFQDVSHDMKRSEELAEKIRLALNESRDNRNIIDDFRPF